jgi:hypothetical protein
LCCVSILYFAYFFMSPELYPSLSSILLTRICYILYFAHRR